MGEVSELPARQKGHITFGTLTRAVRINHHTISVWSQILKRVEGSKLVIDSSSYKDELTREGLIQRFEAQGIDKSRLEIGCHSPPWDVLRSLDIGLDCFPHNSGTTLFETLYMGVPYVSLAGRPSVGRIGSAILKGVGHEEWIARSQQEYVDKAVALASDLDALESTRAALRGQMQASELMDEEGFARRVERAYLEMFAQWSGEKPQAVVASRVSMPRVRRGAPSEAAMNAVVACFKAHNYLKGEALARELT
jgi:predicted O-linked N-acetylglucosamine transferase (SPINDLY family)